MSQVKMRWSWQFFLAVLLVLPSWVYAQSAASQEVTVCADPDPPPWTYWVRNAQNQKTDVFTGFSVDLLRKAFGRLGKTVVFDGKMPWARCLVMVEAGRVDFAMDAYWDADRAKVFDYSAPYNTLTPQVFYRASKPIQVTALINLKSFKGCGMNGASYAHYGLQPTDLDLGVTGYEGLIRKLKAARCDYFVEELEVIGGYKMIGIDYLGDPDIQFGPVPGAKAPAKHLLTARNSTVSSYLPGLNAAIKDLVKSGEAAAIWKKHAPDLPYRP